MSSLRCACCVAAMLSCPLLAPASELKMPKEVTPALRAACEADVRRLCIDPHPNPTVEKVRICVLSKFAQLGKRCQKEIVSAGLM